MEEREIKVQSVRERKFNGSNETVVWDSCFCLSLLLYMFLVCGFFFMLLAASSSSTTSSFYIHR